MRHLRFAALIIASTQLGATTITIVWSPREALVGADAKTRMGNGKAAGDSCKIGIANNVIYTVDGLVAMLGKMDFRVVLAAGLNIPKTMDQRVSAIEETISSSLTDILNRPSIKPSVYID